MTFNSAEIVEKFNKYFKLRYSPVAFFYTNEPPSKVYKPRPKKFDAQPCIIQMLNGVLKRNRMLVLGKESSRLCLGGLSYLGFKKRPKIFENFLSTGIPSQEPGKMVLEGERYKKEPELVREYYERMLIRKAPAKYAVFMPLNRMDLNKMKPDLVIFFVNMDQLGGMVQLFNYDIFEGSKLGVSSACGTIITEPFAEIGRKPVPRAIIGMLSDILARNQVPPEIATFSVPFERLLQILPLMEETFLNLKAWQKIQKRINSD